jgi:hypothetical protein
MAATPDAGQFVAKRGGKETVLTFGPDNAAPVKSTEGDISGATAVAPGIAILPKWDAKGVLLLYDGREDAWLEFDSAKVRIATKFKRMGGAPKSNPVVNTAHPKDGSFEVKGAVYGSYSINVLSSLVTDARDGKVLLPGICHVKSWYGSGSTFCYDLNTDQWVEISAAVSAGILEPSAPPKVANRWDRAPPLDKKTHDEMKKKSREAVQKKKKEPYKPKGRGLIAAKKGVYKRADTEDVSGKKIAGSAAKADRSKADKDKKGAAPAKSKTMPTKGRPAASKPAQKEKVAKK